MKRLVDEMKPVVGLAPITPSSSVPDYVSLKNHGRVTAIITVDNGTTVTPSAITLHQATDVAGTSEKALSFEEVFQSEDVATSDILTETAVVSDTFTTDGTDATNSIYVIEVNTESLDVDNDFTAFRVGTADAVAQVLSVVYIMHDARYSPSIGTSAIID